MDTIPLTTKETQHLRSQYPCIEHLEAGHVGSWLVERREQLIGKAHEDRLGMNIVKTAGLLAVGAGTICYATSPLAPIGALIAALGYGWAVIEDMNASHKFAPLPFIRGSFIEFLSAMGDRSEREAYFAAQNAEVDLIFHLDPFEQKEYAMLCEFMDEVSGYLTNVEPGKRFYAYRWLFNKYRQFRGLPSQDKMDDHLKHIELDPRIEYDRVDQLQASLAQTQSRPRIIELPKFQPIELPKPRIIDEFGKPVEDLPQPPPTQTPSTSVKASKPTSSTEQSDALNVATAALSEAPSAPVEPPTPVIQPEIVVFQPATQQPKSTQAQTLQSVDIALEMAETPKSTIIAASPRVGKGVVVSAAIANIKRLHPDFEIWLIDPKDEPTERHYWTAIDPDKRCHLDLRGFDVDVEIAVELFSDLIIRFNKSPSARKLLIIDEFVTFSQKCAGDFMRRLKDFIVGICSSGEINPDLGMGRFVWIITQSPYVTDIGFKTKAALSVFQRVLLVNQSSVQLYDLAVSTGFVPAGAEQKIEKLMKVTGRVFYYSRSHSWHPVPNYQLPKPDVSTVQPETKPETKPEMISEMPETSEMESETLETPKQPLETPKQAQSNRFSDSEETSETPSKRFTKLKLPFQEARELVEKLRNEMSQTKVIEMLWDAKPGKNKAYEAALTEYKELTEDS